MSLKKLLGLMSILLLLAGAAAAARTAAQDGGPEVERITVDELKARLAGKHSLVIIDTRSDSSIIASGKKIVGAIQIETAAIEQHLKEIPRDREVVTYCA